MNFPFDFPKGDVKVEWNGTTAATISFDPAKYAPDQTTINDEVTAIKMEGHCIGGDVCSGQVRLRFNPTTNKAADRKHAVRRIKEVIFAAKRG